MTSKANPVSISYFDNLPRYLLPAIQAAWDKVQTSQFGTKAIYAAFRRDCDDVGHEPPSVLIMNQWVGAVQNGRVPRPGAASPETPMPEAEFTPITPADFTPPGSSQALVAIDRLTDALQGRVEMKSISFDDLYNRLVEEKVDELSKGVRDQARLIVSEQLRRRLDELA